jgi:hypothetical protein
VSYIKILFFINFIVATENRLVQCWKLKFTSDFRLWKLATDLPGRKWEVNFLGKLTKRWYWSQRLSRNWLTWPSHNRDHQWVPQSFQLALSDSSMLTTEEHWTRYSSRVTIS